MRSVHRVITDDNGNEIPNHPWNKEVYEQGAKRMSNQALVKFAQGIKINIGNYQSAHVEIGIEVPSDVDQIDDTFDKAVDWTTGKLAEEITELHKLKKAVK